MAKYMFAKHVIKIFQNRGVESSKDIEHHGRPMRKNVHNKLAKKAPKIVENIKFGNKINASKQI